MDINNPASTRFKGVVVPMLTPFTAAGEIDEAAARRLLDHLIAGGVEGVLLLGTTGEAASIPAQQREQLVAAVTRYAAGRLTVYAGIGDNSLAQALAAGEAYWRLGVHALVAHLPTYYEITPAEMLAYYHALAQAAPGPLLLYNIPITTHLSIPVETVAALADEPNIVGIKDSQGDLPRFVKMLGLLTGREDFACLWGSGADIAQALAAGADGFVPTIGNLAPEVCHRLYEHALRGEQAAAETCEQQLQTLASTYKPGHLLGQTYGRIKAALGALDICEPHVLPPLAAPDAAEQTRLRAAFAEWRSQAV